MAGPIAVRQVRKRVRLCLLMSKAQLERVCSLSYDGSRQSQNPPLQKSCNSPTGPWSSNTMFNVFTRICPDNSLERLAERSVGLVPDRPSHVDQLFVTLFE